MVRILLNSSVIQPVNIQPFPVRQTLPFHLQNHTDELVHLAIFDYEQCSDTNEAVDELFSIDVSSENMAATDNMQEVQEYLPVASGNLYLVKAYFLEGDVEMIIQKTDNAQTLNLEIILQNEQAVFADNPSYRTLHYWEADQILRRG